MSSTLVDLLQARAVQTPDRLAYTFLVDGDAHVDQVTYGELDQRARALASRLQSEGMTGQRALLVFAPGLEYVTAFLGCLYAGVVAVPVYPPQRKRTLPRLLAVLADADAKLALTTGSMLGTVNRLLHRLSGSQTFNGSSFKSLNNLQWLVIDDLLHETGAGWLKPNVTEQSLAFLQYTSGSTGTPKGVMVSHGNLIENQRVIQQAFGHSDETVVVGWLPLYHDMGLIGNVLQPLYVGGQCILMAPHHFLQKPMRWLTAISHYRATTSGGPNFAYALCINRITSAERDTLDLSCWKVAFNGAEPIRASTLEGFEAMFKPAGFRRETFYPCYGLAEATLMVSGGMQTAPPVIKTVQKSALEQHDVSVPNKHSMQGDVSQFVGCGHVYSNHQVIVVDPEKLFPCAADRIGELWVRGPSVTQGYWNRPEESDSTFRAMLATGEGPFLRTGDLGFIHEDEVFLTGRLKDLMIIRGRNHYPQDLEMTVIQSHPGLREGGGAVFSIEAESQEQVMVVQEVEHRVHLNVEQVAAAIRAAVAESHEIHVYAVVLIKAGSLPKTSSGKVQRFAARDRFLADELEVIGESLEGAGRVPAIFVEPCTPVEEALAEIWTEVLDCEQVSRGSNFFAVGGDSLRGTQVLARLQDVWPVELSLEDLFENPTLAELAKHIEAKRPGNSMISVDQVKPVFQKQGKALPLSFSQERFWFLEQLSPGSPFGNIPIAMRFTGSLDISVLRKALNEIVQRHEILRVSFPMVNGQPKQCIATYKDIPFSVKDLSRLPECNREEQAQLLAMEEARRPFDLTEGPFLRHQLFRLSEEEHILSLTIHHIIADGWSMHILSRELTMLYEAFLDGRPSPLPDLSIQYIDIIIHQQHRMQGKEWKRQLSYWRQNLHHVPETLSLPFDFSRPAVQSHRGARHNWTISVEVLQQLRALGHRYQTTLFMTLLAAFKVFLYRHSGQPDFCVGTPVANRNWPECESLIGCFVNTVGLRADLSGNPSFPELLARVRNTVLRAHENQELPFEQLVDELGVIRTSSHMPLFQVMFVLDKSPSDVLKLRELDVRRVKVNTQTSVFDLTLEIEQKTDRTADAVFEYSTDLFNSHTIALMADRFQELLKSILSCPESRVSELSLLTKEERCVVLDEGNDTHIEDLQEHCLYQLFEAQAEKSPDQVALICDGRPYTYAFVNHKANQLARYLRSQGVGLEVPVGLCVERSFEMVVGMLGSLKAGATYVPIDPMYPKERQASIFKDIQPWLVLTQAKFVEHLPDQAASTLSLDTDWAAVARFKSENLSLVANHDNLAYILYTSGTTGQPKGTGISHRALVNHSTAMLKQYDLCPNDRVLQFASLSFDVAAEECFPTWTAGATVVMRPNEPLPVFADFHRFVEDYGLTVLNLPTPYWAAWIEDLEQTCHKFPASIRLVIVGSEEVLPDSLVRWQRIAGDRIKWCNAYGPTEATITASCYVPMTNTQWTNELRVSIGRPITNVQLYVLDPYLHSAPIGVPGELYIGGLGLARGYHNLPHVTAEKFIPHPFSNTPGHRLYQTGDRARRRMDGNVDFLGRLDNQVKIRGFRVELQEIESHLRQHPQVKEAVVLLESCAPDDWSTLVSNLPELEQDRMLKDIESLTEEDAQWVLNLELDAEERREPVIHRTPEFDVYLKIKKDGFVNPPRENQRNWLLRRALDEFSNDLCAVDAISQRLVPGSDRTTMECNWVGSQAEYKASELIIEGQQVMQDWEAPLMKAMADIVTESKGDVIEVGFGMGISASFIQEGSPRSHSIIECNLDVVKAFNKWKNKYPNRDIRLIQGRWQEVIESLQEFDGVFFDTYPASEEEFEELVINSSNFAEVFFPAAAKLLRPGGVLTYYTNEIDSFSRQHQRLLFKHFSSFTLRIVESLLPPEDCHYWWANSMVVVKAVK